MDILVIVILFGFALHAFNVRDQRVRIALLGTHLGRYRIEKLMQDLTQGYLRALGETDPQRQAAIWNLLGSAETDLVEQFRAFVLEFSNVTGPQARVSRLAIALPYAANWLPGYTFDMRRVLSIHADAFALAASHSQVQDAKGKAFTLMAEMFLMQHSCHWFCRSKMVASARLLARHKTPYTQVLASVALPTRQAYCALVGCPDA